MYFKHMGKVLLSALAVLMLLPCVRAWAATADRGNAPRSFSPAHSVYIDKSLYHEPYSGEILPADGHVVKVGLCFGTEAAQEAVFENLSGGGFAVGRLDENRAFIPLAGLSDPVIKAVAAGAAADGQAQPRTRLLLMNADGTRTLHSEDSGSFAIMAENGALTAFSDGRYYGGFECLLSAEGITVVNFLPLEQYVKGVVPYEMSPYFPFEALRAQAVCARTYAVYNMGGFSEYGFDLTDDTRSQVYRGVERADAATDSAVDTTAGLLVRWGGEICEVYYSSSFGGASESGENVFDSDKPYLAGKYDPFEQAVEFDLKNWSVKKTPAEITGILQSRGYDIGTVTEIIPRRSETDNVIALEYIDSEGRSLVVEGRRCYNMLGLYSCRFEVEKEADDFVFYGRGWGHNCGMSQWGAFSMAQVYGYDFEDIIRFYFTGAYIA